MCVPFARQVSWAGKRPRERKSMADPCTLVIFGASGNLAQVKLLPALYKLDHAGLLHPDLKLVCNGRKPFDAAAWHAYVEATLEAHLRDAVDADSVARFCARMRYFQGDLKQRET
ncbi:MAG TPA: hypothetical protein ENJ21_02155, partial [Chromatiaceae bacterium]|nr:hypothetical protein [Chromatiaceae bacterium]